MRGRRVKLLPGFAPAQLYAERAPHRTSPQYSYERERGRGGNMGSYIGGGKWKGDERGEGGAWAGRWNSIQFEPPAPAKVKEEEDEDEG
jgi:hypothetical protein